MASLDDVPLEAIGPVSDVSGTGLAGEVQHQSCQVPQVSQVCHWTAWVPEHGHVVAGKSGVDTPLHFQEFGGGGSDGDGGEVVLALFGGSLTNGVAAHGF